MDIKGFVHRTPGMLNSSMEFDQKTLTPLYRLRTGEPGQSHAIEIARRYGLPDSIIDSARTLLGGVKVEFDKLIRDLSEKRAYYEKAIEESDRLKAELENRSRRIEELQASAKQESDAAIAKACAAAADIITGTKRQMHALLDAAKKADKEKIKESLKVVEEKKKEIANIASAAAPDKDATISIDEVIMGDTVYIRSIDAAAEVVGIDRRHERIRVKRGSVEVEVPFVGISRGKKPLEDRTGWPAAAQTESADDQTRTSLNIIGLRVDDALSQIEPFLNRAALAGIRQITIIHGIGAGILMKAVREHLKGHPLVESWQSEAQHKGGNGVTIVLLR
jgi:DNA mismatch repair protein MutS2